MLACAILTYSQSNADPSAVVPAPNWTVHELPTTLNADGRPFWEPPLLDLSHLIGEEFEKRKLAMLKLTENDVSLITDFLDAFEEHMVLWEYQDWAHSNLETSVQEENARFYLNLYREAVADWMKAFRRFREQGFGTFLQEDGSYKAVRRLNGMWYEDMAGTIIWDPAASIAQKNELLEEISATTS